ncbi:MAG: glycine zipper 2TM domain-containing protein [Nitrospirae bacterium]|nr:glycine zipper 2TM domain-containing protein [Nitrospirota bacterium]
MKMIISFVLGVLFVSMVFGCTPYHSQGVSTGAAVGGVAGAILDHRNPWRGGVIGGLIGAITGATIADIGYRGGREAYYHDKPVEYYTEDRRGRYYAEPRGYNERTKCRKIREKIWEDGKLIRDEEREICEGQKYEPRY